MTATEKTSQHDIGDVWQSVSTLRERTTRVEGRLDSVDSRLESIESTTSSINAKLDRFGATVLQAQPKLGDYAPLIGVGSLVMAGVIAMFSMVGFFIFRELDDQKSETAVVATRVDDEIQRCYKREITEAEQRGEVKNELSNIRQLIAAQDERIHDHQSNGHPFTVLSKIEALDAAFEEHKIAQQAERNDLKERSSERWTSNDQKWLQLLETLKARE